VTAGEEYFERKFVKKKKEKISENIFLTMWKKKEQKARRENCFPRGKIPPYCDKK